MENKKVVCVNELPTGDFQTKTGVVLSPAEFEKLQSLQPDTLWIIFVDCDSRIKRTNAIIIDFNLAK